VSTKECRVVVDKIS